GRPGAGRPVRTRARGCPRTARVRASGSRPTALALPAAATPGLAASRLAGDVGTEGEVGGRVGFHSGRLAAERHGLGHARTSSPFGACSAIPSVGTTHNSRSRRGAETG